MKKPPFIVPRGLVITVITALLGLVGCGHEESPPPSSALSESRQPSPPEGRPRFAFVTNAVSNFSTIAKKGVDKAAAEFDAEVEFHMPPTGAIDEQKRILEDLVNKGVDGLTVSPIDPINQIEFLNSIARTIPLLCHDSDAPQSERLAYVGTDNYQAGREAGKLIREVLPEGGEIMLFVGRLDAQNAQDRKRGIEEAVADSGITILDTRTDGTDTIKARSNAEDALVANPNLKCLVGLWSYNGPALADALRGSGRAGEVRIVCFDEDEATLEAIEEGIIAATVVQQPYQMGYQSIRLLARLARGERDAIPEGGILDTGVQVVSKDNVQAFREELRRLIEE